MYVILPSSSMCNVYCLARVQQFRLFCSSSARLFPVATWPTHHSRVRTHTHTYKLTSPRIICVFCWTQSILIVSTHCACKYDTDFFTSHEWECLIISPTLYIWAQWVCACCYRMASQLRSKCKDMISGFSVAFLGVPSVVDCTELSFALSLALSLSSGHPCESWRWVLHAERGDKKPVVDC